MDRIDNLIIENAKIIFKNFSGKETPYNRKGDRNFAVIIEDPETAQNLANIGWKVKTLKPLEEDGEPGYYIPVAVSYKAYAPVIDLITKRNRVNMTEETIGSLDFAKIKSADIILSPYPWSVNGRSGYKAYLKTGYFVIDEDPFAEKYAHLDESEQ